MNYENAFEGRWRELIKKLAETDPAAPSEVDSCLYCFFCDAPLWGYPRDGNHEPDCLWMAATEFAKEIEDGNERPGPRFA